LLAIDAAYREVEVCIGSRNPQVGERVQQIKQKTDYEFIVRDLRKLVHGPLCGIASG
jgi:hypothetical protein